MSEKPDTTGDVHEFLGLVRAHIDRALAVIEEEEGNPRASPPDEALKFWETVHGRLSVRYAGPADLSAKVGEMFGRKLVTAALVATHLAGRVAEHEDKSVHEVLDEAELHLAEQLEHDADGAP